LPEEAKTQTMRQNTFHHTIPDQKRASTGIAGLDALLGGGLPSNHLYLGVASYKGALPLLGDADAAGRP